MSEVKRRGFLGALAGVGSLGAGGVKLTPPPLLKLDPTMARLSSLNTALREPPRTSNGWGLLWTGWKTSMDNVYLAAQWLMRELVVYPDRDDQRFVSSTPGLACRTWKGYVFDIMPRPGQIYLEWEDLSLSDEELIVKAAKVKAMAAGRLLGVLPTEGVEAFHRMTPVFVCEPPKKEDPSTFGFTGFK